jgi:SAM-dependent methyltransferase
VHVESAFYDVPGFLSGGTSLREIERGELPDVHGKTLLHLQCHFGLDSLSWARLGATVTGVDLSPAAIAQARMLSEQTGVAAEFVCEDVYRFGESTAARYEVVFTSYGAVCWLPDIERWALAVASCLASGGVFYMVEFHPIVDLITGYSYFHQEQPDVEEETAYTENAGSDVSTVVVWSHPLGTVISALITAGIDIEHVHEFPFSPYDCFKDLVERDPGRFYLDHGGQDVPLVYSIKGTKR